MQGKDYLYFGGTNYLGLAQRPELKIAFIAALNNYGLSSGASRLTSGENEALLGLEADLARFAGSQAALVVPAGFLSNQVAVEALADDVDGFVLSRHAHASIQAAVKHGGKQAVIDDTIFGGKLSEPLRKRFDIPQSTRLAFFAEPIEPFAGRVLDLCPILSEMQPHDVLILDEAHSFGVLGKHGGGACEHYGMPAEAHLIRTGTFSKAIGTYGGFLLGTEKFIAGAKEKSLIFKGSTSLPPPLCAATREALALIERDHFALLEALRSNVAELTAGLRKLNAYDFVNDGVPIFYLPYSAAVARARDMMPARSIYIPTMSSYFAGFCEVGLRFTVQAGHNKEDIRRLIAVLAQAV